MTKSYGETNDSHAQSKKQNSPLQQFQHQQPFWNKKSLKMVPTFTFGYIFC